MLQSKQVITHHYPYLLSTLTVLLDEKPNKVSHHLKVLYSKQIYSLHSINVQKLPESNFPVSA